jgi:hypothetical protein
MIVALVMAGGAVLAATPVGTTAGTQRSSQGCQGPGCGPRRCPQGAGRQARRPSRGHRHRAARLALHPVHGSQPERTSFGDGVGERTAHPERGSTRSLRSAEARGGTRRVCRAGRPLAQRPVWTLAAGALRRFGCPIHPDSGKEDSPNFAITVFPEVAPDNSNLHNWFRSSTRGGVSRPLGEGGRLKLCTLQCGATTA